MALLTLIDPQWGTGEELLNAIGAYVGLSQFHASTRRVDQRTLEGPRRQSRRRRRCRLGDPSSARNAPAGPLWAHIASDVQVPPGYDQLAAVVVRGPATHRPIARGQDPSLQSTLSQFATTRTGGDHG